MYFPTDKLYIETKSIVLGEKVIKKEFFELASWAKNSLNISILNASFSLKNRASLPSLHIVFEHQKDYNHLHGDPENPYNQKYNNQIASSYLSIVRELRMDDFANYQSANFHMSYSVFSKIAVIECLSKINKSELDRLKKKYLSSGLWTISIHYNSVVIFYTNEAEIAINAMSGITMEIENSIRKLASKYDEFNYLAEGLVFFGYDSKENFDKKYKGDWYSYYK